MNSVLKSPEDYRARAGIVRRERTKARLLAAAIQVLGYRGVEASIIDEITTLAGTSRGTFYNYFRSNEDLLKCVAIEAGNDMMKAVAPIVERREDPAWRVAAGVRGWLAIIADNPHLAAFFQRAGLYVLEQNTMVRVDLPRDMIAGLKSGRFNFEGLELGFDIVAGTVLSAINTVAIGNAPPDHGAKVAERILMALGVDAIEARAIASEDIERAELASDAVARLAEAMSGNLG